MTQQTRYCANCGAALAPDARFCEKCGRAVSAAPAAPASPPPYSAPPPAPDYYAPAAPPPPTPPQKSNRWLIIGLGIAGGLALLCCGIMAIVLIYRTTQETRQLSQAATAAAVLPTKAPTSANQSAAPTQPPAATEPPAQPTAVPPTAAPPPADTPVPPTAAPPQPTPDPRTRYDFEGVSFAYDPSLASAVDPQVEPAESDFIISPQHRRLDLLQYPQSQSMHKAFIAIYDAQEYQSIVPDGGGEVANLQQMLMGRPLVGLPSPLPFFTRWNAGQMLSAKIEYIDFQNGAGVRYLTQYGQDVSPIRNEALFYTFQGLTADKKWLISAVMPVSNDVLPDPETLTADPGFYDNYSAYLESAIILLDDLPPSSFVPDLALLDALFQSLKVQ